jgi:hypothetical protein
MSHATKKPAFLTESSLEMQKGLPAKEVDRRLVALAHVHRRIESVLCFYLEEVERRRLYLKYGFASTVDYARERLGFEDRKTRSLLRMAERFEELPRLKKAFRLGDIPWTKAREVVKVATPKTEKAWLGKCKSMSNRQLEQEVRRTQPPVRKKTLLLILEGDRVETWEQAREALERLAGKTLSDIEVFDLMCAEALCTYATTPAFGGEDESNGGFVRQVAERDGWKCTRPGCSNRSALTANHIISRGRSGPDDDWNLHTVCAVCHNAITEGRLKVSGRAPDGLTWDGPFGVIEKPLPLAKASRGNQARAASFSRQKEMATTGRRRRNSNTGALFTRELREPYGGTHDHVILGSRDPNRHLADASRTALPTKISDDPVRGDESAGVALKLSEAVATFDRPCTGECS